MPNDQEFRVHSYGRSFCLRASSDVDRSEWVFALQLVTKDTQVRLAPARIIPYRRVLGGGVFL
jgi:hypothetical protein